MPLTSDSVADSKAPAATFRFKGGLFPFTVLEINRYDPGDFERDLQRKVAEAPAFFQQTPVILSFETEETTKVSLESVVDACRQEGLIPVVLRGGDSDLRRQASALGIAHMPEGRTRPAELPVEAASPGPAATSSPASEAGETTAVADETACVNRVITTPVRSGQQVYAAGGDLIVLSSVSTGAEVLADGNIHIYGALRGRALAGVKGDASARIFCQSLEAELISVAGDYKLDEDFRSEWWKKPVKISLEKKILSIRDLS